MPRAYALARLQSVQEHWGPRQLNWCLTPSRCQTLSSQVLGRSGCLSERSPSRGPRRYPLGPTSRVARASARSRRNVCRIVETSWKPTPYVCRPTVQTRTTCPANALPSLSDGGTNTSSTLHLPIVVRPRRRTRSPGRQAGPLTSFASSAIARGLAVMTRCSVGVTLEPTTQPRQRNCVFGHGRAGPMIGSSHPDRPPYATRPAGIRVGHGTAYPTALAVAMHAARSFAGAGTNGAACAAASDAPPTTTATRTVATERVHARTPRDYAAATRSECLPEQWPSRDHRWRRTRPSRLASNPTGARTTRLAASTSQ